MVRTGTNDFAAPTREYTVKAIELIEANKKPAELDENRWKEYQTKWLPQLYQSLGFLDFYSGNKAQARANFEKGTTLNPSDVNNWIILASMLDEEYQELATKYNAAPAGAEREQLLKQANEKMDNIIELYARIVAMTDGNPAAQQINSQIRENLESYYKYRHKNSTDGMKELINKYKAQK